MAGEALILQFLVIPTMMIFICAMNLIVTHRRAENRFALDGKRLEAALIEELRLLVRLYRSNLYLLDQQELRLISTRIPLAVFRANVGRITLLDEESIRQVVAVHANNEHIEMMVAERAKSIKNGQCTVYVFDKAEGCPIENFRELFQRGLAMVETVVQHLEAKRAADDVPGPVWVSGQKQTLAGQIGKSLGFAEV
jgi:hypothetical protein